MTTRGGALHKLKQHLVGALILVLWAGNASAESAMGNWITQFKLPPGLDGPVYAMVSTSNAFYVAGSFSKAGGVPANNVAKWDGTNWSALGDGIDGQVFALAVMGTNLYAGGQFHSAGTVGAINIAKWNGTNWEPLGGGVDQEFWSTPAVFAIYASGTNLFVGGQFDTAGDITAYNIARWDGNAWHSMDTGVYLPDNFSPFGTVWAITGDGTNVYAGGVFEQAGEASATNIARWDGNVWHGIGDCTGGAPNYTFEGYPHYGMVSALTIHQGFLFAGGSFGYAGGVSAQGLARWDGTAWSNVGDVSGGRVSALESYSGNLYVAGSFTSVGGITATNAAIWSSGEWSSLNAYVNGSDVISSLKHFGPQLYLCGSFGWMDGVSAGNVIQWDQTNWMALGQGTGNSLDGPVYALATDGTNVFATGMFGAAGTNPASGLAKWDGANWSAVGLLPPADGAFFGNSLAVVGSNVYVGGGFQIPEAGATNLAVWNGSAWSSLGGPLTDVDVIKLLAVGNVLYLSGAFTDASGKQFGPVARWDGTNWAKVVPWNLGTTTGEILATDQTNLYIAKGIVIDAFTDEYGVQVLQGDGTTMLGDTFTNLQASALAVSGTNVYLAGSQTTNNYAPTLYCWNGSTWQTMGAPLADSGTITAILPVRGNIYVVGSFSSVNGTMANCIAKWTGTNWLNLGSGVSYGPGSSKGPGVFSAVALGRKIFVGGQFTSAGGFDSGNIGLWNEAPEIRLSNTRQQSNGDFEFDVTGISGDEIEIQASSTLSGWTPVATITLGNEIESFSETSATNAGNRFYRARFIK